MFHFFYILNLWNLVFYTYITPQFVELGHILNPQWHMSFCFNQSELSMEADILYFLNMIKWMDRWWMEGQMDGLSYHWENLVKSPWFLAFINSTLNFQSWSILWLGPWDSNINSITSIPSKRPLFLGNSKKMSVSNFLRAKQLCQTLISRPTMHIYLKQVTLPLWTCSLHHKNTRPTMHISYTHWKLKIVKH